MGKFFKKGFIITVDAFLGVTLMLLLILLSLFFISQTSLSSWNLVDLRTAVNDTAVLLEESKSFENSIKQSSGDILLSIINESPENYCFEVTVLDYPALSNVVHVVKSNCTKNSDTVIAVSKSVVINDHPNVLFYIAKVEGWIK